MKKAVVLFLVTVLFLTACSEEETQYPNPNDTADEYMEQWMEYDFEKLYENYLSEQTKSTFSPRRFCRTLIIIYMKLFLWTKLPLSVQSR